MRSWFPTAGDADPFLGWTVAYCVRIPGYISFPFLPGDPGLCWQGMPSRKSQGNTPAGHHSSVLGIWGHFGHPPRNHSHWWSRCRMKDVGLLSSPRAEIGQDKRLEAGDTETGLIRRASEWNRRKEGGCCKEHFGIRCTDFGNKSPYRAGAVQELHCMWTGMAPVAGEPHEWPMRHSSLVQS